LLFPLELALDLPMQGLLVGPDLQEEVGALRRELLKNGFWMCKHRFSSPSSFLSTARSWFSPVAWQACLIAKPSADV
jgi:hypothetical protein